MLSSNLSDVITTQAFYFNRANAGATNDDNI